MNGRTQFVVVWLAVLYIFSWLMSLGRLFGIHFWDPKYALDYHQKHYVVTELYNSTALSQIGETYYSPRRYHYLLPHIIGAIVWWNSYFLQLIPKVRHAFQKKFHRILGRCLMVCAFLQTATGVGLALTSHSNSILITSLFLAVAVGFCIYHAWMHAIHKDIPKHKYWVLRLVGYLQTIAFQRFYMFFLILTHKMGWYLLYPELTESTPLSEVNRVVLSIFDDSFILAAFTALLGTEWYLAGEQGMLASSTTSLVTAETTVNIEKPLVNESKPLQKKKNN